MSYSITRVDPARKREETLAIWKLSFPHLSNARFNWIYLKNPAGQAALWLAHTDDGAPIGAVALVNRDYIARGRSIKGGIVSDYAVVPDHRAFGPALALQRQSVAAVSDGVVDFVYGIPNSQAAPLLRRAGYKSIGTVTNMTRLLKSRGLLRRKMGDRLIARVGAWVVDRFLTLHLQLKSLAGHHYTGEELASFDDRFTTLSRDAANRHPLIGDRRADFLRWRFGEAPQATYQIYQLMHKSSKELAGYIVFYSTEGRTVIADLEVVDLDGALDALLTGFLTVRHNAGDETVAVSFFGDPKLVEGLRRNGFSVRNTSDPVMVHVPEDSPVADIVLDASNWWLLPADIDV